MGGDVDDEAGALRLHQGLTPEGAAAALFGEGDLSEEQVAIPEAIRRRLGLESGTEFVVFGEDGTVVFQVLEAPSMREFDEIVARARKGARRAGLRKSDITEAIRAVRSA